MEPGRAWESDYSLIHFVGPLRRLDSLYDFPVCLRVLYEPADYGCGEVMM